MAAVNGVSEFFRKLSLKSTRILVVLMALLLMAFSAINIWMQVEYDIYAGDLIILIPFCATFAIALISLFTRRIDVFRLIGVYALMLGFQRVYINVVTVDWNNGEILELLFGLIFIGLGLNLMLTGVSFTIGKVIRRTSMMITSIALVVFELFKFEIVSYIEYDEQDLMTAYILYKVCLIGMYLCIIGMMDSEDVRGSIKDARYANTLNTFRNERQHDKGTSVTRDVAQALTDYSSPLWKPGPGGPVEAELPFVIKGYSTNSNVVVQRWKGDDRLFFTIHEDPGSILFANRFAVDRIELQENRIHMIGKGGIDAVLWVRD